MSSAQRGIIKNFFCVCVCVSMSVSHRIASLWGKKMYSNNPQEQRESRPVSGFHREMTDGSLRPHQTTADRSVTINRGLTCRRGRQTNTTLLIPAEILSLSAPSSESKGAGSVRTQLHVTLKDTWVMKHKVCYFGTYAAGFILSHHKLELQWID